MLEDKYRAIILLGPFKDLSDVLRVARHQGKIIFNVRKVSVHPHLSYSALNEIIVKVKPEENNNNSENLWKLKV